MKWDVLVEAETYMGQIKVGLMCVCPIFVFMYEIEAYDFTTTQQNTSINIFLHSTSLFSSKKSLDFILYSVEITI